jgi:hypothetical protein
LNGGARAASLTSAPAGLPALTPAATKPADGSVGPPRTGDGGLLASARDSLDHTGLAVLLALAIVSLAALRLRRAHQA